MDYKKFMLLTLLRPGSTEYALFVCFDPYFHARLPLDDDDCLRNLDLPISIVYGDRDWMTNVGTHDLLSSNPYMGTYSHNYTLSDSDHNLFFDNPTELVEIILKDLSNLKEFESQKQNDAPTEAP
jgi:pimeloyl-ACP methyl ester carboxylesterase